MENDFELEQVSVRLVKDSPLYSDERIITAESAVKIIGKELMTQLDREQLCIVNLNSFGQPINFSIVSVGQIDQALVNPREMLKASILSNAANAIVIHNHPSGSLVPSRYDIRITKQLIKAYKMLGIGLIDHVIFGGNNLDNFHSMRQNMDVDFNNYKLDLGGELEFANIADRLNESIGVFLVAEDLAYWVNTNYTTIYLTNDEAELILRYMDREGYNLGVDDDELIRIKSDTDEIEKYNLEDAIYSACDISEKRIKSLEEEIKNPRNFMTLCEVRQMLKAARKEEKIIDGMFKKTSLGRMVGLKPEEKKNKEKQKENNMHGH